MTIAEFLREYCESNVISQSDLALILGVSKRTIERWVMGKSLPNNEYLKLIAVGVEVPLEQLVEMRDGEKAEATARGNIPDPAMLAGMLHSSQVLNYLVGDLSDEQWETSDSFESCLRDLLDLKDHVGLSEARKYLKEQLEVTAKVQLQVRAEQQLKTLDVSTPSGIKPQNLTVLVVEVTQAG